jgi:hypothetical protein
MRCPNDGYIYIHWIVVTPQLGRGRVMIELLMKFRSVLVCHYVGYNTAARDFFAKMTF